MQPARLHWPWFNATVTNSVWHFAIPVVLIAGLAILLHTIPEITLAVLAAIASALLAYNFPLLTIGLTILLGQVIQFELAPLFGISPEGIALGSVNLRLSDPLVFGITVTVFLRLASGERTAIRFCKREGLPLILFLLYLLIHVASSARMFGASAPGEFRTYYQVLLFVPYVVVSTRSAGARQSLFFLLVGLSLSQVLWGLLRGSVLFDLKFSAYEKWLSGFGSLALLYGVLAVATIHRLGIAKIGLLLRTMIYVPSVAVLLMSGARAVWLAGACACIFLFLRKGSTVKEVLKGLAIVVIALAATLPLFVFSGLDPAEFLMTRLLAFTDFASDPTAAWRYSFWLAAIDEALRSPWFGSGLGLHFSIHVDAFNEIFTTSPHNLYLSILFHSGVIGLALYGWWVVGTFSHFRRTRVLVRGDQAILMTGLLVLIAVHAYGVAYSFEKDFFTWLYIGLAISAIVQEVPDQIAVQPRTIKRIP